MEKSDLQSNILFCWIFPDTRWRTTNPHENCSTCPRFWQGKILFLKKISEFSQKNSENIFWHQYVKIFCMNISAKFICRRFSPRFHAILPYCDFIFGNEAEAEAYAVHNGLGKGLPLEQIAQKMASYEKINLNRPRCVIITQVFAFFSSPGENGRSK